MTGGIVHQRCWNHEAREAVCGCPGCSRPFCRECVTEHERRLLCAVCLQSITRAAQSRPRRGRMLLAALAAFGGVILSWSIFYIGGEILLEITARAEHAWRVF